MIAFSCTCGHKYEVPKKYAGKRVRCKHCDTIMKIPSGQPQEEQQFPLPDAPPVCTTTEYHSNRKIWCLSALLISVFCIGLGSVIYTQHNKDKKEKALYATCETLVEEAEAFIKQNEYKKALEKYITVQELISDSGFNSSAINYLLENTEDQIQTLKSKIFANLHLPELNEIKKEAYALFSNGDFDGAAEEYGQIIEFITTHQKQEDIHFKSLFSYSQKRIDFPIRWKIALAYTVSDLSKNSRANVDKMYTELIKELQSLKNYSEGIEKRISKLKDLQAEARAYYNEVERKYAEIQEKERLVRLAKEKMSSHPPEAFMYWEKAANMGVETAFFEVENCYEHGVGTAVDIEKAVFWYEKAVSVDNSEAFARLGLLYVGGLGAIKDVQKAIGLFRKGVQRGNPTAMCYLGFLYEHGEGLERDGNYAFKLYEKAVLAGSTEGMVYLGRCYLEGIGVEQNRRETFRLWTMAASEGNKDAINFLSKLKQDLKIGGLLDPPETVISELGLTGFQAKVLEYAILDYNSEKSEEMYESSSKGL